MLDPGRQDHAQGTQRPTQSPTQSHNHATRKLHVHPAGAIMYLGSGEKSMIGSGASFCFFAFPLFFTTVEYSVAESGSFLTEHK
jgi:hypothetical protein